jgi:serine/threonine protein kinase
VVTEFVKQGSLRCILSNSSIKLKWEQKMLMLRGAAMGIHYLHTRQPSLIHRDLKSDNLLVCVSLLQTESGKLIGKLIGGRKLVRKGR